MVFLQMRLTSVLVRASFGLVCCCAVLFGVSECVTTLPGDGCACDAAVGTPCSAPACAPGRWLASCSCCSLCYRREGESCHRLWTSSQPCSPGLKCTRSGFVSKDQIDPNRDPHVGVCLPPVREHDEPVPATAEQPSQTPSISPRHTLNKNLSQSVGQPASQTPRQTNRPESSRKLSQWPKPAETTGHPTPSRRDPCELTRCTRRGQKCVSDMTSDAASAWCVCKAVDDCKSKRRRLVCGSDGQTYPSLCALRAQSCRSARKIVAVRSQPCNHIFRDEGLSRSINQAAPFLHKKPRRRLHAVEGMSITLRCAAIGRPTPRLIWEIDGKSVYAGDRFSPVLVRSPGPGLSTLRIKRVHRTHAGNYSCIASNSVRVRGRSGHAIAMTTLEVFARGNDNEQGDGPNTRDLSRLLRNNYIE